MEILDNLPRTTRIQKYMDFSKFMDLIDTKNIFLSKASCFEDKAEGSLSLTFELLHSGYAAMLDIAINHLFPYASIQSEEERKVKKERTNELHEKIENRTYPTPFGQLSEKEISFEEYKNKHSEWIDVTCWHAEQNESENMAMWKIYGGTHNSVCIITDIDRLERNLIPTEDYKIFIGKVEYIKSSEDEFKYEHTLAPFIHKSVFYQYENEIRIIGYSPNRNLSEKRLDYGSKIKIVDTNNFIQEIRVSPYAPDWFYELVKSICNKYSLTIPVNRSQIHGTL